jgi:hypothetical protein
MDSYNPEEKESKNIGTIGTLNEYTIHSQLKSKYAGKNDKTEQKLEGYIIDIIKKTGLVEIQTTNFSKIKPKLKKLLVKYRVKLVHNIPSIKWLIKTDASGNIISKRKSSKRGNLYHIFDELIYLIGIVSDPNFSLEILITEEEEIRKNDGRGSRRRRGVSIKDRKLVRILEKIRMNRIEDYLKILPGNIKEPFSTKDVARELKISIYLSQRIVYFLKNTKLIECTGKKGNLLFYVKNTTLDN